MLCEQKIPMPLPSEGAAVPLVASQSQTQNGRHQAPISPTPENASVESMIASLIQERRQLPKGKGKRRKAIDDKLYQLRHAESYRASQQNYYQSHFQKWVERRNNRTPEQTARGNESTLQWVKKHPERRKAIANKWYARHKDVVRIKAQAPEMRAKVAAYLRHRRKNDPDFRLRGAIRSRISSAMRDRGLTKNETIISLIGCTFNQLKAHLESQFSEGMKWGEPRRYWHIDHIIPIRIFDLRDTEELHLACNWKNMRPIWGRENQSKHIKLPDPLPDWLPSHIAERIKSRKNHLPL